MTQNNRIRECVVSALAGFMEEAALQQAIAHWDNHYAQGPRHTLQKFVYEITEQGELRGRRSSILLSLMNAITERSTTDAKPPKQAAVTDANAAAFMLFMTTLFGNLTARTQHSLRLDLLASLSNSRLPRDLVDSLLRWLDDGQPLRVRPQRQETLRALANHVYVLLCERLGPVEADRRLAFTVESAQVREPRLMDQLTALL